LRRTHRSDWLVARTLKVSVWCPFVGQVLTQCSVRTTDYGMRAIRNSSISTGICNHFIDSYIKIFLDNTVRCKVERNSVHLAVFRPYFYEVARKRRDIIFREPSDRICTESERVHVDGIAATD